MENGEIDIFKNLLKSEQKSRDGWDFLRSDRAAPQISLGPTEVK